MTIPGHVLRWNQVVTWPEHPRELLRAFLAVFELRNGQYTVQNVGQDFLFLTVTPYHHFTLDLARLAQHYPTIHSEVGTAGPGYLRLKLWHSDGIFDRDPAETTRRLLARPLGPGDPPREVRRLMPVQRRRKADL